MNKTFSHYVCHITDADAPGSYRGFVYAANTALLIRREKASACRSGAEGGGVKMRTNVIYNCAVDPPSPPPSPPLPPPSPAPNTPRPRHNSESARAVRSVTVHHAGRVVLTVLGVLLLLCCVGGFAAFLLLRRDTDFSLERVSADVPRLAGEWAEEATGAAAWLLERLRELSQLLEQQRRPHAPSRLPPGSEEADSDDEYEDEPPPPPLPQASQAQAQPLNEVYGARYKQPEPRTGPAATFT
ncbi:hypothetical protein T492DRAFT_1019166 [Pavlovales sp. CCMP2436]|nr:hypothetical protein T492DRAFT_1019166 [Pavlovales sp. CCMP2436]